MYIDKSFQLLSADSGKVATDETRRQNAGDDEAEFGELLDAELSQHDQQKESENTAGTDKKAGQEVAALLTKQAKTAEQLSTEKGQADQTAAVAVVDETIDSAGNTDKATGAILDVIAAAATETPRQVGTTIDPGVMADFDTEQAANSDPWLAIISQSHDFNELLSQSSPQSTVATNDAALTSAETLVAGLVGLPVTEKTATGTDPAASGDGQSTESADNLLNEQKPGHGKELISSGDSSKTPLDSTLLNIATGQQDAKATATAGNTDQAINSNESGKTVDASPTTLPAEKMSVREMFKSDQPHLQTPVAKTGEQDGAAADVDVDQQSAPGTAVTGQAAQLQIKAEAVASPLSQTENTAVKHSATAPVDIELPIEVSPDVKALSNVVTEAATAAPTAKNAPQSFAQFQKAANAAASLVQKQQMQAELTQQPLQELAAQQPQKFAELNQTLPGTHSDAPIAFNTLLQTDRPISSSGGAMGSSTGQQQQQAASQLFATKLSDTVHNSEQPALNLLEPNAATQLKERVMFQVNQKIHSAEIKLAPEELGNMQIKVQLQQEQLSVQFVVQQAGAKEALEQQMPRLREMLEEQGIELKDGQVSQQREGSDEQRQARERNQVLGNGTDMDDEPLQQQAMIKVSDRMVDYYA